MIGEGIFYGFKKGIYAEPEKKRAKRGLNFYH
jgi:hypothetical protein